MWRVWGGVVRGRACCVAGLCCSCDLQVERLAGAHQLSIASLCLEPFSRPLHLLWLLPPKSCCICMNADTHTTPSPFHPDVGGSAPINCHEAQRHPPGAHEGDQQHAGPRLAPPLGRVPPAHAGGSRPLMASVPMSEQAARRTNYRVRVRHPRPELHACTATTGGTAAMRTPSPLPPFPSLSIFA